MQVLKKIVWVILGIFTCFFVFYLAAKTYTKSHSPEKVAVYQDADFNIKIKYSSPFKKNREIFGLLVPYSKVWRTGANEATTFSTNKNLKFNDGVLPAGEYTLWTIPNEDQWEIIFNNKNYPWGIRLINRKAYRESVYDVLSVMVNVEKTVASVESFTISFSGKSIILMWDMTKLSLPFSY